MVVAPLIENFFSEVVEFKVKIGLLCLREVLKELLYDSNQNLSE